jgi:signal peptidase II
LIVAFLVFAVDLLIKRSIMLFFAPAQSVPLIKGFLHLTYVQNTGVAFGLFRNQRPALILIGIIVCAVVVYFYTRTGKEDKLLRLSLAIILGGSLGNLFDRVFYGYVIDYIDFRFFPVFNLADIAINLGVFLVLLDAALKRSECTR